MNLGVTVSDAPSKDIHQGERKIAILVDVNEVTGGDAFKSLLGVGIKDVGEGVDCLKRFMEDNRDAGSVADTDTGVAHTVFARQLHDDRGAVIFSGDDSQSLDVVEGQEDVAMASVSCRVSVEIRNGAF